MVVAAAEAEGKIDFLEQLLPNPVTKPGGILGYLRKFIKFGDPSRVETLQTFLKDLSGINTRIVAGTYKPRFDQVFLKARD